MKKVLFLDRDGTLVHEPSDYQVDALDKVVFYPGVFQYLGRIVRELDYELVMVTNQDGLGTESFPEEHFWPAQNLILNTLKSEGITFREILVDRTFKHENAPTRKPDTGMVLHYLKGDFNLEESYVIGDRITDMLLARNMGAKGIWLNNDPDLGAQEVLPGAADELEGTVVLRTPDWKDIYHFLRSAGRRAVVKRETNETQIYIELDLDGQGRYDHQTGIGFFDHMLDQLARHANLDLAVGVKGDLHIDEHHTIEDTAIALGEAFRKALGDKRGIERYGFYLLPMDDCLAQVAIDFSGRPWLVWEADFQREKVGGMPTEMFEHFFKSFSDHSGCNLNVKATGKNEHHKIEAIFKAFARAVKMAVRKDPGNEALPTTKGSL